MTPARLWLGQESDLKIEDEQREAPDAAIDGVFEPHDSDRPCLVRKQEMGSLEVARAPCRLEVAQGFQFADDLVSQLVMSA